MVERVPHKRRFSTSSRIAVSGVIGGGALFIGGNIIEQQQSMRISSLEASRDVVRASLDSAVTASKHIAPRVVLGQANGKAYIKRIQLADPRKAQASLDAARATLRDASSNKESKVKLRYQEETLVSELTDIREATTHVDPSDLDSTNKVLSDLSSIISELDLDRGKYDERRARHLWVQGVSSFVKWSGITSIIATIGYLGFKDAQVFKKRKSPESMSETPRNVPVE